MIKDFFLRCLTVIDFITFSKFNVFISFLKEFGEDFNARFRNIAAAKTAFRTYVNNGVTNYLKSDEHTKTLCMTPGILAKDITSHYDQIFVLIS